MARLVLASILAATAGCTGRGTVRPGEMQCESPAHAFRPLDLQNAADRRHLRDDAIAAEDFAIGHADANAGRHSVDLPDGYDRRRDQCMASVFALVSARHGVTVDVVTEYRLRRDRIADAAVIGSVALLYLASSYVVAGMILRRFRAEPIAAAMAVAATSLALGGAGTGLGEVWSVLMETARLGRGHLSYRVDRIPWVQYRLALFVAGAIAFCAIAIIRHRTFRRAWGT